MIDVLSKTCEYEGCMKKPNYRNPGESIIRFCVEHKQAGMVSLRDRTCEQMGCLSVADYNEPGEYKGRFCEEVGSAAHTHTHIHTHTLTYLSPPPSSPHTPHVRVVSMAATHVPTPAMLLASPASVPHHGGCGAEGMSSPRVPCSPQLRPSGRQDSALLCRAQGKREHIHIHTRRRTVGCSGYHYPCLTLHFSLSLLSRVSTIFLARWLISAGAWYDVSHEKDDEIDQSCGD